MSAKVAQSVSEVVAGNVRRWREARGLDQQALATRLADLGWPADRTAIVKIEQRKRKVSVEDLALVAVALNVPVTVMLTPVAGGDVTATPDGATKGVNRWRWFEWMIGNEPLPGRLAPFGGEWRSGAEPLWLYERVRRAQRQTKTRHEPGEEPESYVEGLQELVDAVADMEAAGWPAGDLIGPERKRAIKYHHLEPTRARRFVVGEEHSHER